MINDIPAEGTVEPTRAILKIGATQVDFVDFEIEFNGILDAGTFRASLPVSPAKWGWWAQQTEIVVDVWAGTPKDPLAFSTDDLTHFMVVRCDTIELDIETSTVVLAGRDMTGLLIDNKTTDKWPNKTSSEIATIIAGKMGMTANIQATTTAVGDYYIADYVKLAKAETYWNILTYLAQHEGFQCFVLGKTLYFGKYGANKTLDPYVIRVDANGKYPVVNAARLKFGRNLTLAQDISVTVRSFNPFTGSTVTATATASKKHRRIERHASLAQGTQHFDYRFPGLTQAQCSLKAQNMLSELSKHELEMTAELPFDAVLYPWVPIRIEGSGTPWDAQYSAHRIRRHVSLHGVRMTVEAKTGVPQQTVTLS